MRLSLFVVLALAVVGAGCGGVEQEPNLRTAIERTEAAGSGRFEVRGTQIDEDERVSIACTGTAVYESKRVRVRCEYAGHGVLEAIAIGPDTSIRGNWSLGFGSGGDKWIRDTENSDDDSALASLSPQTLLTLLRKASSETERIGDEDIRG